MHVMANVLSFKFLELRLCFQDQDGNNIELIDEAEAEPQQVPPEKRMCTPYMTKYERARVLGTRALQIAYVQNSSQDQCFPLL